MSDSIRSLTAAREFSCCNPQKNAYSCVFKINVLPYHRPFGNNILNGKKSMAAAFKVLTDSSVTSLGRQKVVDTLDAIF